jgi:hypothetical protein
LAQLGEDAERAAAEARRHALTLVQPCPPVLSEDAPLTAAGLRALAGHLEQTLPSLAAELGSLSAEAGARYAEREDEWAPVAAAVSAWCASAGDARAGLAPVASVKAAGAWLKG